MGTNRICHIFREKRHSSPQVARYRDRPRAIRCCVLGVSREDGARGQVRTSPGQNALARVFVLVCPRSGCAACDDRILERGAAVRGVDSYRRRRRLGMSLAGMLWRVLLRAIERIQHPPTGTSVRHLYRQD